MVPTATNGEVHTWLISVADAISCYDGLYALLSTDEQERAARYLHAHSRHEFVAGRGCLRLLLGQALKTPPGCIAFHTGEHGKLQTDGVEFNLSHAHGMVAIAVSAAGPVGIDIEFEDRAVELMDVAEAVFTAEELAQLRGAPTSAEQRRLFFAIWTANEARAKCLGLGLAHLHQVRRDGSELDVQDISMPRGYQGALCLRGPGQRVVEQFLGKAAIARLLDCRYET